MTIPISPYGRVFDLVSDMIFVLGAGYQILDHNKAASEKTGYGHTILMSMTIDQLVAPERCADFQDLLVSTSPERSTEVQFIKADGSRADVELDVKVLHSKGGPYQIVIATDVTEQKKKELDLLRFSNVIHHTVNPIQITDARGVMVYVNPAFERTSGYRKEELIGKNPSLLSSGRHSKEFWARVWKEILSGKMWVGQLENRKKDGSTFHTELVISPIVDAHGSVVGFLGAHRDITEQKALEQQLVRSQKMEAIGTLAAGIAHEVGNPLTSISSLVQVILRTTEDEFAKEKLEMIKNQISRITRIIRDLVDFSRPSNYVIKETDINEVLKDAMNIVRYGKKVSHIDFRVTLTPSMPKLKVVPDQLVQVFINILMNAVDALENRHGSITLVAGSNSHMVEVKITDTGRGIEASDREKIFEPFYSTKEVGKGTGLGLWVSYGIVKNFGGEIQVESTPEKGSTFTVLLPIQGV